MIYYVNFLDPTTKKVIVAEAKSYPNMDITDGEIRIEFNDYSYAFDIHEVFGEIVKWNGENPNLMKYIHGQTSNENVPLLEQIVDWIRPITKDPRSIALRMSLEALITLGKDYTDAIWETYTTDEKRGESGNE